MSINRIFEGLSKVLDSGNQEQTQSKTATPTFAPQSETTSTENAVSNSFTRITNAIKLSRNG